MTLAVVVGGVKSHKGNGGEAGATEYRLDAVIGTVLNTGVARLRVPAHNSVGGRLTVADEPLAGSEGVDEGDGLVHKYIQSRLGGQVNTNLENLTM